MGRKPDAEEGMEEYTNWKAPDTGAELNVPDREKRIAQLRIEVAQESWGGNDGPYENDRSSEKQAEESLRRKQELAALGASPKLEAPYRKRKGMGSSETESVEDFAIRESHFNEVQDYLADPDPQMSAMVIAKDLKMAAINPEDERIRIDLKDYFPDVPQDQYGALADEFRRQQKAHHDFIKEFGPEKK